MDWTADPSADNLTLFVRKLIALRARAGALRAARFPEPGPGQAGEPVPDTVLQWFDPDGVPVAGADWDNPAGHSFAVLFADVAPAPSVLVMVNGYWGAVTFTAPGAGPARWTLELDTMSEDGSPPAAGPFLAGASIQIGPRSVCIATG